jgi:hypothetical protein
VCEAAEGEEGPPDCSGRFRFQCQNDNDVNFHTDLAHNKKYDDPYEGCADYLAGGVAWETVGRKACSAHCFNISGYNNMNPPMPPTPKWEGDGRGTNYLCDPVNWTNVDYAGTCTALTPLLDLGPVLAALGSTAAQEAAQLPCDLSGDCSELLDFWAREAMWTPPDPQCATRPKF